SLGDQRGTVVVKPRSIPLDASLDRRPPTGGRSTRGAVGRRGRGRKRKTCGCHGEWVDCVLFGLAGRRSLEQDAELDQERLVPLGRNDDLGDSLTGKHNELRDVRRGGRL